MRRAGFATIISARASTPKSERVIQKLLAEAGKTDVAADVVSVNATGAEAAPDTDSVLSPETYVGYERAENFVSPGGAVEDMRHVYAKGDPRLNEWGLSGDWTIYKEHAVLNEKGGRIPVMADRHSI